MTVAADSLVKHRKRMKEVQNQSFQDLSKVCKVVGNEALSRTPAELFLQFRMKTPVIQLAPDVRSGQVGAGGFTTVDLTKGRSPNK